MKTSRICAAVVATLATFAAGHASAGPGDGTGGGTGGGAGATAGTTVILNTYSKVWVNGDLLGPKGNDGTPKLGKDTGAGIMDANFTWDTSSSAMAARTTNIELASVFTRSSLTPNDNNSYMQGGFVTAKLGVTGVA